MIVPGAHLAVLPPGNVGGGAAPLHHAVEGVAPPSRDGTRQPLQGGDREERQVDAL